MARHRTKEEQAKLVADSRGSRKSVADFCAERGLAPASLNRWVKAAPTRKPAVDPELRFVRLERAKEAGGGLVVEVKGALVRVERGFDAELLRGVVEVLSGTAAS